MAIVAAQRMMAHSPPQRLRMARSASLGLNVHTHTRTRCKAPADAIDQIHYVTEYGQNLFVCGSVPELGKYVPLRPGCPPTHMNATQLERG